MAKASSLETSAPASLACSSWSQVIGLRSVWQELSIRDTTLTRWTYNYGTSRDEVREVVQLERMKNEENFHSVWK